MACKDKRIQEIQSGQKRLAVQEMIFQSTIQQTNDGGYIIAASTNSFGAGNYDAWLIRTNADGDTIWTRTYGGADTDHASDVKQTDDNGFIIAGSTRSFGHANNYNDAWLIKTNFNGDTTLDKNIWR